jgi:AraC-like DNA-binding protein
VDVISSTMRSVRLGRANGRRVAEAGAWGLRFPAMPAVGFHVMLSGSAWLITPGAEPVAITTGDIVFTGIGAEHGIARHPCRLAELPPVELADLPPPPAPADFEFLCGTYVNENAPAPALLRRLPAAVAIPVDYARHPQLRAVVEMLRDDYTSPGPGSEAGRAALIDLIFLHILRHLHDSGRLDEDPAAQDRGVAEALRELHAAPERPWTVQQLSDIAGLSRTAFTRRFTAVVGRPPMSYLLDWRLTSGASLLQHSDAPLQAIARRVGYSTEYAFSAAFRRKYGIPPGRFRAQSTTAA